MKELLRGLLLNNKSRSLMSGHLLYFKCGEGHITQCNTPKHRLFFCKECNTLITKKECARFTDKTSQLEQRGTSKKIKYGNKILYQFPESHRRYYPRKKKELVLPA